MTDQTALEITDADSDAAELFEYLQGHIHQDKVHDAARRAMLSDATGGFFDEHLFRETLRAAANAIAAWYQRASPVPEPVAAMGPVAWMYYMGGAKNCYAYQLPDWSPGKDTEQPLYAHPPADPLMDEVREAIHMAMLEFGSHGACPACINAHSRLRTALAKLGERT